MISPHRQDVELGQPVPSATYIENRKFSDYTSGFIPEVNSHLQGDRSRWLSLWINSNELGRPAYQISGFGPAHLLSWFIGKFTKDPWLFLTVLSLSTCFLAGLFILLFCRETGLTAISGLTGAITIATAPLLMVWLTFPMFLSVWCWSAGALWAVSRLMHRLDFCGWFALVVCSYSLLISAYPQPVVFHAYLLAGYTATRLIRPGAMRGSRLQFLGVVVSAPFLATLLALPVYRDLAHLAQESARLAPDVSFFSAVLPKINSWTELWQFMYLSLTPDISGNPIDSRYGLPYDGLSITPVVLFSAIVALFCCWRQAWGWWLAVIILIAFTFIRPLFEFGVMHLGFNLSRTNPLGSTVLPITVLVAWGINAISDGRLQPSRHRALLIATCLTTASLVWGVIWTTSESRPIQWLSVCGYAVIIAVLAAQIYKPRPVLSFIASVVAVLVISWPLILRQEYSEILSGSELTETIRKHLPSGSRYAIVEELPGLLPPNINNSVDLASVHSYNSLSSRRYHDLIKALGGQMKTYGRTNRSIRPDVNSSMFWMSNIGVILSAKELPLNGLIYLESVNGVRIYRVLNRMGSAIQVSTQTKSPASVRGKYDLIDPRQLPMNRAERTSDATDRLEFRVKPTHPSLFVVSQKYHRDWQAQELIDRNWRPAKTVVVNGVFQGVELSQNVSRVLLSFKPWSRFAWIAHLVFLLLLMGWAGHVIRNHRNCRPDSAGGAA